MRYFVLATLITLILTGFAPAFAQDWVAAMSAPVVDMAPIELATIEQPLQIADSAVVAAPQQQSVIPVEPAPVQPTQPIQPVLADTTPVTTSEIISTAPIQTETPSYQVVYKTASAPSLPAVVVYNSSLHQYVPATPEPASILAIVTGLVGMAGTFRRRSK
ncbi:MAG: PEP-CTERM sorting domain-containing protein [Armatimonadota bacterium]|nr:PEP-CTERM sorting domain-containing protein [bacterium]